MTKAPPDRLYLPALDGLRFVGFMMIFFTHIPAYTISYTPLRFLHEMGWIGLDLLFSIGGFIFSVLLATEYQKRGRISVSAFLKRRALRIWPGYFLYLLVVMAFGLAGFLDENYWVRVLGMALFIDNFMVVYQSWSPYSMGHLWTVSFEQQIYIVFPVLFALLFPRLQHRPHAAIAFACLTIALAWWVRWRIVQMGLPNELLGWKVESIYVMPFLRCDTFVAGALAGYLHATQRVPMWAYRYGSVIGIGVIASLYLIADHNVSFFEQYNPWTNPSIYPPLALANMFIIFGVVANGTMAWRLLSHRPIAFLGRISYGLYLYHAICIILAYGSLKPAIDYINQWVGVEWLAAMLLSFAILVGVAVVSYYLVERPFIRIKERFSFVPSRII